MATLQDELIEFYRQLSLLAKANLPLPQSLQSLARDCQSRKLAPVIASLADDVGKGIPLSDALGRRGDVFSPLHVHIIAAGERGGVLMEALREVANIVRIERRQTQQLREIAAYPALTTVIATGLVLGFLRYFVPGISDVFWEMLGPVRTPALTRFLFWLSSVVIAAWPVVAGLYAAGSALLVWLIVGGIRANQTLQALLPALPGTGSVVRLLDAARAAGLCAVMLEKGTPIDHAFRIVAGVTRRRALSAAFIRIAERCESGKSLSASAELEREIPDSLRVVFAMAAERDMPRQLRALQDLYAEQADMLIRRLGLFWEVGVILLSTSFVATVIVSLFSPLITFLNLLGA